MERKCKQWKKRGETKGAEERTKRKGSRRRMRRRRKTVRNKEEQDWIIRDAKETRKKE